MTCHITCLLFWSLGTVVVIAGGDTIVIPELALLLLPLNHGKEELG